VLSQPEGSALYAGPSPSRRGWPLSRRAREPDSFGLLLVLIVAAMFGALLGGRSAAGATIATALAAAVLVFALRTSVAPRRLQRAVTFVAPLLVLATLLSHVRPSRIADVATLVATALLVLGALVAVGRRLISHSTIGGPTILGAVCVYLLLGLLFASIYGVLGAVGRIFVQQAHTDVVDLIYFSFITLATVGYGDLTPSRDLLRILAVVESLLGQLYLVTVIAVLVSNVGTRRGSS
jgi:Ion channel